MTRIQGADPDAVRAALASGDPFPGASADTHRTVRGFAGRIDGAVAPSDRLEGAIVRDVLGRVPVYTDGYDPGMWSFDPSDLDDPRAVPAGHARTPDGDEQVWTLPDPAATEDDGRAIERVREAVRASVDAVEDDGLAVAFSGGVDSAAVAARLDAPLYVTGFPESHDVEAAREAATALDRDLRVVTLSHADIERAVPRVVAATGRTNAMDVSIAVCLFLVAERAAADGYDRLAVGQGADELFGGYAKVARAPEDPRVEAETVRGARHEVVETLPGQLERDVRTLRGAGVEPVAPLLDDRVVAAALSLPGSLLVSARDERKWALRRAVREWLPDEVAFRDKKAVQYGSLVSRELDRLARQAGFKRRMDDHVSRYVESISADIDAEDC